MSSSDGGVNKDPCSPIKSRLAVFCTENSKHDSTLVDCSVTAAIDIASNEAKSECASPNLKEFGQQIRTMRRAHDRSDIGSSKERIKVEMHNLVHRYLGKDTNKEEVGHCRPLGTSTEYNPRPPKKLRYGHDDKYEMLRSQSASPLLPKYGSYQETPPISTADLTTKSHLAIEATSTENSIDSNLDTKPSATIGPIIDQDSRMRLKVQWQDAGDPHSTFEQAQHFLGYDFLGSKRSTKTVVEGSSSSSGEAKSKCFELECSYEKCNARACIAQYNTQLSIFQCRTSRSHNHSLTSWKDAIANRKMHLRGCIPIVKYHINQLVRKSMFDSPMKIVRDVVQTLGEEKMEIATTSEFMIAQKGPMLSYIKELKAKVVNEESVHGTFVKDTISSVWDLKEFKRQYMVRDLKLHGVTPKLVTTEDEVVVVGKILEEKGALKGKKHKQGVPHLDLITLPFPDEDHPEMKRARQLCNQRQKKSKGISSGGAVNTTVAFSSLALLRTACDCVVHNMLVPGCIDGTDKMFANNWTFITLGVISFQRTYHGNERKWSQVFKPLCYVFGEGEREEVALLGSIALIESLKRVFGIEKFRFLPGVASDWAFAFVNTILASLSDNAVQCYAHIFRSVVSCLQRL